MLWVSKGIHLILTIASCIINRPKDTRAIFRISKTTENISQNNGALLLWCLDLLVTETWHRENNIRFVTLNSPAPSTTLPRQKRSNFLLHAILEAEGRWENMIVPNTGSFVSVTAKVVGRTSTNQLAVRVLDLTYLPKPPSHNTPATPSNAKKRQDRWGGRAQSSPSKKPRSLTSSQDSVEGTHTEMDFDEEERTDTPPTTQINQSSSSVRTQDVEIIDDDAPNVPAVPERRHRKQRRR